MIGRKWDVAICVCVGVGVFVLLRFTSQAHSSHRPKLACALLASRASALVLSFGAKGAIRPIRIASVARKS